MSRNKPMGKRRAPGSGWGFCALSVKVFFGHGLHTWLHGADVLTTQTLVLFVIRSAGKPWANRPSAALAATTVLSVLAGGVLLFTPGLSLATLVLLTGISSIVVGAGEVGVAFALKRAPAA